MSNSLMMYMIIIWNEVQQYINKNNRFFVATLALFISPIVVFSLFKKIFQKSNIIYNYTVDFVFSIRKILAKNRMPRGVRRRGICEG